MRERALRTARLCCSPTPPRLFTESTRATLVSSEPRLQRGAAALCASAAVSSAHFHSPCGCFDAFCSSPGGSVGVGGGRGGYGGGGGGGGRAVSPFNPPLKFPVARSGL